MSTGTSARQADAAGGREERLERFRRVLSGQQPGVEGRRQRRRDPEASTAMGVWLHAAARADMGLELTEWERALLAPLEEVLGQEEVRAIGRVYREQRDTLTVARFPQVVAHRSFDEPFTAEEFAAQAHAVGKLAADQPNVAWMNRTRLLAGEPLETPEFTEAAEAYGYGLTLFNGAQFGAAEAGQETAGTDEAADERAAGTDEAAASAGTPFRAKLEWDGFRCHQAAGDQGGGRDEIYWTAVSSTVGYEHTTRTSETGEVRGGNNYSIRGDHATGSKAFFDANYTGNLCAVVITCWEADDSTAAWYEQLGKALKDAAKALTLADYATGIMPGQDLAGYAIMAINLIADFWEYFRNDDDLILTRGYALSRSDLKALYYTEGQRMRLQFNARSSGMGDFSLLVKYTGAMPPGPAPEGSFRFIATGWTGLLGSAFTSGLDAACDVPGSRNDAYLFKGDKYVRYNCDKEEINNGVRTISEGWPGLKGTIFTSGLDAACAVPGSTSDAYLFKGDRYVRYNCDREQINNGVRTISEGWPGLKGTIFTSGLDAACRVPGSTSDIYLFKGDKYVRYNCDREQINNGIRTISAGWPRLTDTEFADTLQAGCAVPGNRNDVYLFKGDRYVRYTI
ncbi:hypothetical protein [Streptomyces sp. NPDC001903]|uniref:hypothetical protein n=1 Tax=Streptomyces sp. NPDC001903 TaxID=3364622 RepID=UPI0036B3DE4A